MLYLDSCGLFASDVSASRVTPHSRLTITLIDKGILEASVKTKQLMMV
jgi:hypothetical protein